MKIQISNYNILTDEELNFFNTRYKCRPDDEYQNVICETYRVMTSYITKHPIDKTWYIYNKLLHKKLTLSPYILQIYMECQQLKIDVTPFDVRNIVFIQFQHYRDISEINLIVTIQRMYNSKLNKISCNDSNVSPVDENNSVI